MTKPSLRVLKFGGTSVQDAPALRRLVAHVAGAPSARTLVVVSALAGVTDELLSLVEAALAAREVTARLAALEERHRAVARELTIDDDATLVALREIFARLERALGGVTALGEASPRTRDLVVAQGELLSSRLIPRLVGAAQAGPLPYVHAPELLRTDARYGSAAIDWRATREACARLEPRFEREARLVVGGFVGSAPDGSTTTLGRGGSDYTAAVLAAALGAEALEFWKDVDGLLTADPRLVARARLVPELSYGEAAELCYFGAKILHPETMRPAVENGIPIEIRNSRFERGASVDGPLRGTRIVARPDGEAGLKSLTLKRGVTALHLGSTRMLGAAGFLKSVFDVFAAHDVSVDLISTSEVSVSLTLERRPSEELLHRLRAELSHVATVAASDDNAVLSCVGEGLRRTPGLAGRIFGALDEVNVRMISQGASELNLGLVLADADGPEALRRLHRAFFEGDLP